jgi:hypothetical protein
MWHSLIGNDSDKSKCGSGGNWEETTCCHSHHNLVSSYLLSKNANIRIYKTVILSVVLYGCENWSLTLREEHRVTVFENRMLRRIFGWKRGELMG